MKKIEISFNSYRPRLHVGLIWTTDLVPNVGDEIIIDPEFISNLDTKYFEKWRRDYSMNFRVKKRIWNTLDNKESWNDYDFRLELDWTEEELVKVKRYLDAFKKNQSKKRGIMEVMKGKPVT